MKARIRKAYNALVNLGVPVLDPNTLAYGGVFGISAENNVDVTWADYYCEFGLNRDEAVPGVDPRILNILRRHGLSLEWDNPGMLSVRDEPMGVFIGEGEGKLNPEAMRLYKEHEARRAYETDLKTFGPVANDDPLIAKLGKRRKMTTEEAMKHSPRDLLALIRSGEMLSRRVLFDGNLTRDDIAKGIDSLVKDAKRVLERDHSEVIGS